MLIHRLDWKGTDDGIAALHAVRDVRPDAHVVTFGVAPVALESAEHLDSPGREAVADILRRSAVFVCSSWEEGFGMPGLEALACGTALATTDTKGSRDYAVHDRTALVSEPRDVDALSSNVLRLLGDARLRGEVAAAGHRLAARSFPEWPVAARAFVDALGEVVSQPVPA